MRDININGEYKEITLTCIATSEYDYLRYYSNTLAINNKYNIVTYELTGSCNHKFQLNNFYFNRQNDISNEFNKRKTLKSLIKTDILDQLKNIKLCRQCGNNNFINKEYINIIPRSLFHIEGIAYSGLYVYCGICLYGLNNGYYYETFTGCVNNLKKYVNTNCPDCGAKFVMPSKYWNTYYKKYININEALAEEAGSSA